MENFRIYNKNAPCTLRVESSCLSFDFKHPETYHTITDRVGTGILISDVAGIILVSFNLAENARYMRGSFLDQPGVFFEMFVIKTCRDRGFSLCKLKTKKIPEDRYPIYFGDSRKTISGDDLIIVNHGRTCYYPSHEKLDGPVFDRNAHMIAFVNDEGFFIHSYSLIPSISYILDVDEEITFDSPVERFTWQKTNQRHVDLITGEEGFSGIYITSSNESKLMKGDLITHISYMDELFSFEPETFDGVMDYGGGIEVTGSVDSNGLVKICDVPMAALEEISLEDKPSYIERKIELSEFLSDIPYDSTIVYNICRYEKDGVSWLKIPEPKSEYSGLKYIQPTFDVNYRPYSFFFGLLLVENNLNYRALGSNNKSGVIIAKILKESEVGQIGYFNIFDRIVKN